MKMKQLQVNTKFLNSLPPEWSKFVTDVKLVKDLHTTNFNQLHAYLEQHKLHENEVRLLRERNQDPLSFIANQQMTPPHFNTYQQCTQPKRPRNAAWYKEKAMLAEAQEGGQISNEKQLAFLADTGEGHMARQCTQPKRPRNAAWYKEKAVLAEAQEGGQISDEKQLAFLADTEVPHSETYLNDIENQSVHTMQDFKQTPVVDVLDNKIHSDRNIIPYSQYLEETHQANVQDTHLQSQQD
nr:hypothetical protein [Tanacetum cinerariifolium]